MRYEEYDSLLMTRSGSICYISDIETYELLHLTKGAMDLCGLTDPEQYRGQKCYKILHGLDEPCPFCTNARLSEGKKYRWERHDEKRDRWFKLTDSLVQIDGRKCRIETALDVTARKKEPSLLSDQLSMEDILFRCLTTLAKEKDLNTAVNLFLEAIGGYYRANRAYIFEFDLKNQTINNTFEWCLPGISAEIDNLQQIPMEYVSDWIEKFETVGEFSISSLYDELDHDSEDYRILEEQGIKSLLAAPLYMDDTIVGFLGVDDPEANCSDLTLLRAASEFILAELDKRRLMAELEYISYTDLLTGMKNRNQYIRLLKEYDRRTPETLGVVFVDINGLKGINDSYGHDFGDYVIRQTAQIMVDNLSGSLFRIGGDEFVAMCEGISKEEFQEMVLKLRKAYEGNRDCNVSIGCVWKTGEMNVSNQLLQADELMYAEKQSYYHTVLKDGRNTSHVGFASEVLKEIEEDRFVVFYQPQVDIQTGRIIGAEALVRKKADDGGMIPPDKFIPFYEVEGVISHVDLHVLETACATMRQWLEQDFPIHLSVNFSRVTLMEPGIVDKIREICEKWQVPTSSITIEVTESISKMDHEQLKNLIKELNEAGFTISLDDFGSQYSNLAILAAMDFDEIKFDKTLTRNLEDNPKSRVVMENSVRMCRDLKGTSSLAEGIETKGQLDLLMDYHCNYGQGYYFSKPVPLDEFDALLKEKGGLIK